MTICDLSPKHSIRIWTSGTAGGVLGQVENFLQPLLVLAGFWRRTILTRFSGSVVLWIARRRWADCGFCPASPFTYSGYLSLRASSRIAQFLAVFRQSLEWRVPRPVVNCPGAESLVREHVAKASAKSVLGRWLPAHPPLCSSERSIAGRGRRR